MTVSWSTVSWTRRRCARSLGPAIATISSRRQRRDLPSLGRRGLAGRRPASAIRRTSLSARLRWGRSSISPFIPTTPASGWAAKASMTECAQATASAEGVKASLMTGTWLGWIANFATNPSRRAPALRRQAVEIAEIGVDRVDGVHLCGCGREERERAGGRDRRRAVLAPVRLGSDVGREVFAAPGDSRQAPACPGQRAEREHAPGALGRDRDDARGAVFKPNAASSTASLEPRCDVGPADGPAA